MSRIGKKPVAVPNGVTAKVDGQKVTVKGAGHWVHTDAPAVVIDTLRQLLNAH